ncbi:hypothetical protein J4731_18505, partial [Providencia rettgeri]|nr:hypothetical protein [Providencia rettgeri]
TNQNGAKRHLHLVFAFSMISYWVMVSSSLIWLSLVRLGFFRHFAIQEIPSPLIALIRYAL